MSIRLIVVLVLLSLPGRAQQLQILRSDGRVFDSAVPNDYVIVKTVSRDYSAGRITRLTPDTLTVIDGKQTKYILINQIAGLKKSSRFGISARRLSLYAGVVPILFLPSVNSKKYEGRTLGNRLLNHAAIIIPVTAGLSLLMQGSPLKKTKRGYSFQVAP